MKRRKITIIVLMTAMMIMAVTACQSNQNTPDKASVVADYKVTTMFGAESSLYTLLDQSELTMIHVWDPTCEDCQKDIDAMQAISQEYAGRGIQVIGVMKGITQTKDPAAQAMLNKAGAAYVQLLDVEELEADYSKELIENSAVLLVDRKGRQQGEVYGGTRTEGEWKAIAEEFHAPICEGNHPAETSGGG